MIPDLGKYAFEVTAAYGVSLTLIVGLVWAYCARSNRVAKALKAAQERDDA